jgi:hypothetical protein
VSALTPGYQKISSTFLVGPPSHNLPCSDRLLEQHLGENRTNIKRRLNVVDYLD